MKTYSVRLIALLIAAILPVVAIASVLVVYVARQERRVIEGEAQARVRHLVDLMDREIGAHIRVLEALATSASLDGPDLRAFHDEARRVLASQPGWRTIILNDLAGRQLLSARQPFEQPPVRVIEPQSYEAALRSERPIVGGISEAAPGTGVRAVPIRVAVRREGTLRHILTAPVLPDSLLALLRNGAVPATAVGVVVDREGRIVARSRGHEVYVGQAVNEYPLAAIRSGIGSGLYDGRTLDGTEVVAAFATSGLTGWTVHLGVPRAIFEGPLNRAVLSASLGGLGCILLACVLVWLLQRDMALHRRRDEVLRQAQKMEAIGRMTGGVAHDFNNMLAVVRSAAELLRRRPDDPRRQLFLDGIVEATERGAKLTRQLLSFAGRRAWRPEPIDLSQRLLAMAELLRSSLRGDIDLHLDIAEPLWPVLIDPGELEFALLNLVVNARDAMPEGGTLRLTVGNVSLPRPGENPPGLNGDHVRLAVTDTGTGMPPEIIERAFEPFFTTKDKGKGTGLGLSQVYGFARQSGGMAVIRSRQGVGTTVTLYLPRTTVPLPAAVPAAGTSTAVIRGLQVLLVEDDPAVARATAALLEHLGHAATVADRGDKALSTLDRGQRFDLVLSDIVMPGGMDGIELAHAIRQRWPNLPILLATGYSVEVERGAGVPSGVPILRKPYSATALEDAFARALRDRTAAPAMEAAG